jgi:hypothetical protein
VDAGKTKDATTTALAGREICLNNIFHASEVPQFVASLVLLTELALFTLCNVQFTRG